MAAALAQFQFHLGHDFHRQEVDAQGAIQAIFMLGAAETSIRRFAALFPTHQVIEVSRRTGVGVQDDWLRVNIIPRESAR